MILDYINQLNGSHYINLEGGKDLYSRKFFNNNNIKLSFLRNNIKESEGKLSAMKVSILHFLFNYSKEEMVNMFIKKYSLIQCD